MNLPLIDYQRIGLLLLQLLYNGINQEWMHINTWLYHPTSPRELFSRPYWWFTWWAIPLSILAMSSLAYGLVRYYTKHQEAQQLRVIDAMKARCFTNITHEFRTPLTLIIGPAQQLKERLHKPDDQYQIDLINQNANKLLGLINQLMDLSKAEAGILQVNESQGDIAAFVARLVQSFHNHAQSKGILLVFRADQMASHYWFDAEKLEHIVTNLIANALKFTPVHGKVTVSLSVNEVLLPLKSATARIDQSSWLHLEVSDNGVGIASDKLPHIFDRFYQVHNDKMDLNEKDQLINQPKGTGIGLALVKELVDIQQGTIQVVSKKSIGSTFTVHLPCRRADSARISAVAHLPDTAPNLDSSKGTTPERPVILLAEDNVSLGDFIASSLPSFYQIHRAMDGVEGIQQAVDIVPDLIISDVLMPRMDGFTFCRRLKEDSRTSHIPVILLTAKASVESRLEGLSSGADDYIAKPFNVQELQLRVRNLLDQRRQQRDWIMASLASPDPHSDSPAPTDPLLQKLTQIIEDHLDESSFGAEELTLASGMSRMNLHRKLKALGEFIRNYRLKRAAQLLRQGHSVSETAYLVGFEDPSYFARSFRKVYEMTPSAFAQTNQL
jgi:signal transduction histidine kinase/DNA-binding response OmpR family regulator